jgi:hypothetical protein
MNMCHIKDTISIFLISFFIGLIIGRIYLNEKRIFNLEKSIFVLENKIDDLIDVITKI